jgi:hypothetical protein
MTPPDPRPREAWARGTVWLVVACISLWLLVLWLSTKL